MKLDARVLALASALAAGGCAAPPETTIPHTEEVHYTSQAEHERVSPRITPINVADDGTGVYEVGPVGFTQRVQLVDRSRWNGDRYDGDKDVKNTVEFHEAQGTPLYTVQAQSLASTPESAIEALVTSVSEHAHVDARTAMNNTTDLNTGSYSKEFEEYASVISSAQGIDVGKVTVIPVMFEDAVVAYLAKGAEITVYGGQE